MKKLLTILFMLPVLCFAANKYVSGTGSDGNSGSLASPYRTIDKIDGISLSGIDSVLFERGYDYSGSLDKSNSNIVYAAYGSGAPPRMIYNGGASPHSRNVFRFTGNNVKVIGLNFTYPTQNADRNIEAFVSIGILFDNGQNETVTDCLFSKIGTGIFYQSSSHHFTTRCDFNDMRTIVNDGASDNDYGANGILFSDADSGLVTFCSFDSCMAPSIDYGHDGGALEAFGACNDNVVLYCTMTFCDGIMENGASGAGTSHRNTVAYSKIVNSGELVYTSAGGGFPVQVDSMRIWHCTIIDTVNFKGAAACFNYDGSESSATVFDLRDNIFYLKGGIKVVSGSDSVKTKHANNGYYLTSGSSRGFALGPSELTINIFSTLVNTSGGDYHLQQGCSSEHAGQDITGLTTNDFAGNSIGTPPNLGVYGPVVTGSSSNAVKIPFWTIINGVRVFIGKVL